MDGLVEVRILGLLRKVRTEKHNLVDFGLCSMENHLFQSVIFETGDAQRYLGAFSRYRDDFGNLHLACLRVGVNDGCIGKMPEPVAKLQHVAFGGAAYADGVAAFVLVEGCAAFDDGGTVKMAVR